MERIVDTYQGKIYMGLKEGYDGPEHDIQEVIEFCQKFVDEISFCVTVERTYFTYTGGGENGVVIGAINYPRFPMTRKDIIDKLSALAGLLIKEFKQQRLSIVFSDYTVMLEDGDFCPYKGLGCGQETLCTMLSPEAHTCGLYAYMQHLDSNYGEADD